MADTQSNGRLVDLFQRDKSVISRRIHDVFDEGKLQRERVVANFATTATDGKTYQVEYFNLDVIISVGYRVKSHRGTQFRIWATQRLREYIVKCFTMNERLKQVERSFARKNTETCEGEIILPVSRANCPSKRKPKLRADFES